MRKSGFTVIELMITTSVLTLVGLGLSHFMTVPVAISRNINSANQQVLIARGTDFIVNDIKEGDPSSIDWSTIQSTGTNLTSFSFNKVHYDLSSPGTPVTTQVVYTYQLTSTTKGTLSRTENGGVPLVLLTDLDAPNESNHIFVQDPVSYHVILMTLLYHPVDRPLLILNRRISFRG